MEVFGKRLDDFSAADKEDLGIVLSESSFSGMFTVSDAAAIMGKMYRRFDQKVFFD